MSDSDSEILVHLYEEYGEECLSHLNGEFAFVLWDGVNQRIFASRDRFGIKPLYFTRWKDEIWFALEEKAFFALGLKRQWDARTLMHVFTHQYPTKSDLI